MKDLKKDKLLNAIELLFKVRKINLVKTDEPKEYFGKKLVDPLSLSLDIRVNIPRLVSLDIHSYLYTHHLYIYTHTGR